MSKLVGRSTKYGFLTLLYIPANVSYKNVKGSIQKGRLHQIGIVLAKADTTVNGQRRRGCRKLAKFNPNCHKLIKLEIDELQKTWSGFNLQNYSIKRRVRDKHRFKFFARSKQVCTKFRSVA